MSDFLCETCPFKTVTSEMTKLNGENSTDGDWLRAHTLYFMHHIRPSGNISDIEKLGGLDKQFGNLTGQQIIEALSSCYEKKRNGECALPTDVTKFNKVCAEEEQ